VQKGQVVALDDDVASRWGPRVVDLVKSITDAVAKVPTT
jgi:iron complex transport system substrate-binding protein